MFKLFLSLAFIFGAMPGFAQDEKLNERLTQEEFCVEVLKNMKMEGWLPTAALGSDCISLLERLGVAPLTGWNNKAFLSQEDYLVVMAELRGKEEIAHRRAVQVEARNKEVINSHWSDAYKKEGRWMTLTELLSDKNYFPEGSPQSPYGFIYRDEDNNHRVDEHTPFVWHVIRLRQKLALD